MKQVATIQPHVVKNAAHAHVRHGETDVPLEGIGVEVLSEGAGAPPTAVRFCTSTWSRTGDGTTPGDGAPLPEGFDLTFDCNVPSEPGRYFARALVTANGRIAARVVELTREQEFAPTPAPEVQDSTAQSRPRRRGWLAQALQAVTR